MFSGSWTQLNFDLCSIEVGWIFNMFLCFFFFCLFCPTDSPHSWLLHLWIMNWCKWPYWPLNCNARLVKLILVWNFLCIIDYILNITVWMYFLSTLVRVSQWKKNITEKTDGSSSVSFCPSCSKKVIGLIPTPATPSDCDFVNYGVLGLFMSILSYSAFSQKTEMLQYCVQYCRVQSVLIWGIMR